MIVSCPQCKAKYQLTATIKNAILVCHRCGTEFHTHPTNIKQPHVDHEASLFDAIEPAESAATNNKADSHHKKDTAIRPATSPLHKHIDNSPNSNQKKQLEHIQLSAERLLPQRREPHIWHWLVIVLLCISGLGFWSKHDQWAAQPWLRSIMINMQLSADSRPTDWHIIQDNLHSQWVSREDGSSVLLIDGYIKNLLLSDQKPPSIRISFYDMPNSQPIQMRTMPITEPPSLANIRHTPYNIPPVDLVPVSAGGQRAFTLVLENIPKHALTLDMEIATPQ